MIGSIIFYFFIAFEPVFTLKEKTIIIGKESDNEKCDDCIKFTKLLEGLEYSFLSVENVSVVLLDNEYHLRAENFSTFLQSNKTTYFFSSNTEIQTRNISISGRNSSFSSKIIFHDEIFTIDWKNLNLRIENIHVVFFTNNVSFASCFLCFKTLDKNLSLSALFLQGVKFESLSRSTISLFQEEFALIDVYAESFSLMLSEIEIKIVDVPYFKNLFRIIGNGDSSLTSFKKEVLVRKIIFYGENYYKI